MRSTPCWKPQEVDDGPFDCENRLQILPAHAWWFWSACQVDRMTFTHAGPQLWQTTLHAYANAQPPLLWMPDFLKQCPSRLERLAWCGPGSWREAAWPSWLAQHAATSGSGCAGPQERAPAQPVPPARPPHATIRIASTTRERQPTPPRMHQQRLRHLHAHHQLCQYYQSTAACSTRKGTNTACATYMSTLTPIRFAA